MMRVLIVVPCYNEAARLDTAALNAWIAAHPAVTIVFVNDGSTDATAMVLGGLRESHPEQVLVHELPKNGGKAEAVRQGLRLALAQRPDLLGYLDADLATPLSEFARLIKLSEQLAAKLILASRVALLGRHIERRPTRHYVGRLFATAASLVLNLRVYDTQCGAKLLRPSEALSDALASPFHSRWAFDVELIGRMLNPSPGITALRIEDIYEEPLNEWRDIPGSKLSLIQMLRSGYDLIKIARELRLAQAKRAASK